jgi:hypothetical protein
MLFQRGEMLFAAQNPPLKRGIKGDFLANGEYNFTKTSNKITITKSMASDETYG